jgi:hypothetical protein
MVAVEMNIQLKSTNKEVIALVTKVPLVAVEIKKPTKKMKKVLTVIVPILLMVAVKMENLKKPPAQIYAVISVHMDVALIKYIHKDMKMILVVISLNLVAVETIKKNKPTIPDLTVVVNTVNMVVVQMVWLLK